jgi:hypothetical protein
MKSKNTVALFVTLILVSCSPVSTQVFTTEVLVTSTLLSVTATQPVPTRRQALSPAETATFSNRVVSERLCTPEDFNSSSKFTDLNSLETLIGFRPDRDWLPAVDWEETIGIYDPQFDYSIAGFRSSS